MNGGNERPQYPKYNLQNRIKTYTDPQLHPILPGVLKSSIYLGLHIGILRDDSDPNR